jgi:hypothetical protein
MRILSFTKKWDKLKQSEFTTFRFERKDSDRGRDWHLNETVQLYYHNRCKDREFLGIAKIINKFAEWTGDITEEEAIADGFPGGIKEMRDWLEKAHHCAINWTTPINKLTLKRVTPDK